MVETVTPSEITDLSSFIHQCDALRIIGLAADSSTIGQLVSHSPGLEKGDWLCAAHILRTNGDGALDGYLRLTDITSNPREPGKSSDPTFRASGHTLQATLEIERLSIDTEQPFRDPIDHWYLCVRELLGAAFKFGLAGNFHLLAGYAEMPGLERLAKLGLPIVTHGRPVQNGDKWLYRFHTECNTQNMQAVSNIRVVREAPQSVRMTEKRSRQGVLKELAGLVASAAPRPTQKHQWWAALKAFETRDDKELDQPQRRWIGD